jgi:hypothetical protein
VARDNERHQSERAGPHQGANQGRHGTNSHPGDRHGGGKVEPSDGDSRQKSEERGERYTIYRRGRMAKSSKVIRLGRA